MLALPDGAAVRSTTGVGNGGTGWDTRGDEAWGGRAYLRAALGASVLCVVSTRPTSLPLGIMCCSSAGRLMDERRELFAARARAGAKMKWGLLEMEARRRDEER